MVVPLSPQSIYQSVCAEDGLSQSVAKRQAHLEALGGPIVLRGGA